MQTHRGATGAKTLRNGTWLIGASLAFAAVSLLAHPEGAQASDLGLNLGATNLVASKTAVFSAFGSVVARNAPDYKWDFDGDGHVDAETTVPYATHTFDQPGTYTASVSASDGDGDTGKATKVIVVSAAATATPPPFTSYQARGIATTPLVGATFTPSTLTQGALGVVALPHTSSPSLSYGVRIVAADADNPWLTRPLVAWGPLIFRDKPTLQVGKDLKPGRYLALVATGDRRVVALPFSVSAIPSSPSSPTPSRSSSPAASGPAALGPSSSATAAPAAADNSPHQGAVHSVAWPLPVGIGALLAATIAFFVVRKVRKS